MANSAYYYDKYKKKKSEVSSYEKDIKNLNTILNNLTDTMYDEIRAINGEIEDLQSDLSKSVRHVGEFTTSAKSLTSEKEQAVTADANLKVAVNELNEEITRVTTLKNQAAQDRDYYYRRYKEEKDAEWREWQEYLASLVQKGDK